MSFVRFLMAVFSGRVVRFLVLAILTMKFGPDVVRLFGDLFRRPLYLLFGLIALGALGWLLHRRRAAQENSAQAEVQPATTVKSARRVS